MDPKCRKDARCRFEDVLRPHFEALHRAAMRLTRSRSDAEDLVQDVVLRAWPELERLEAVDSPRAWLLKIQYRAFVDGKRRDSRSPFVESAFDVDCDLAASSDPGPDDRAETTLRQRRLARVWPVLDPGQRALLALHAEGYSLAELEEITGLTRNAVGVRLHRARARLARLLDGESAVGLRVAGMEN